MNQENNKEEHWDLVIEGESSLFDLKFKDVWRYRDLLMMFVKRDFISSFKQTILGPLWFFIQPLLTTITFTFVFGNLAGISSDGLPKPLFYMAGITAWNYFSDCLNKTSAVFSANASIFGKVYFPRLIMPISIVVSNLMRFGVQMIMFVSLVIYYKLNGAIFEINSTLLLFPLLVILMALLGLGMGMIITSLTTKYKDLQFLLQFGITLLMYGTTVIYPLSVAPLKYKKWIELNPMTGIIEAFRYSFLGKGEFSTWSIGYSSVVTIVILFFGIIIFNRTERNFIDSI
jgi:lipopolysaccharide transport system permease protein